MTVTCAQLWRRAAAIDADLYHLHDPELLPVGIALRLAGKHVVYDAHEDLPKAIRGRHWIPRAMRPPCAIIAGWFERFAAGMLSGIVSATPAIRSRFPRERSALVRNYPILNENALNPSKPYGSRPSVVAYIGGLTHERGARELVTAMGLVSQSTDVRLAMAGVLRPAPLELELKELPGWERIDFLGWRSRDEVSKLLGDARIGLVTFLPAPNHIEAQPNKLFEYMSAGIPLVASNFALWSEIVSQHRCGILVDPTSPEEIAQAIDWILANPVEAAAMGERGRDAVTKYYNWQAESRTLLDFYSRILGESSSAINSQSESSPALRKSA